MKLDWSKFKTIEEEEEDKTLDWSRFKSVTPETTTPTPSTNPRAQTRISNTQKDIGEPSWGAVAGYGTLSGLGSYQTNLLQIVKMVQEGGVKLVDAVDNVLGLNIYDPKNDKILNALNKEIEKSKAISTKYDPKWQSDNSFKNLVGSVFQNVPQLAGSAVMGMAFPTALPVAQTAGKGKDLLELIVRGKQMIPFGASAAAGGTIQFEEESKALDKEAPYLKKLLFGVGVGAGEVMTELPVFIGLARVLDKNMLFAANKTAETITQKFGKLGQEWIKGVIKEGTQEGVMESVTMSLLQGFGIEVDWKTLPPKTWEAFKGGAAMYTMLGIGGMSAQTQQIIEESIAEKRDLKGTMEALNAEIGKTVRPEIKSEMQTPEAEELKTELKTPEEIKIEVAEQEEKRKAAEIAGIEFKEEPISKTKPLAPKEISIPEQQESKKVERQPQEPTPKVQIKELEVKIEAVEERIKAKKKQIKSKKTPKAKLKAIKIELEIDEAILKQHQKQQEEILKTTPKAPSILELTPEQQHEYVPIDTTEAQEILKAKPKKPAINKIKLAEEMVAKKVSLTNIETAIGEKVDVTKPKDIVKALEHIEKV
ncbi:MAG: hypothetical protein ACTSQK_09980, partial [Candidatus Heimdallarchaeota archaeon]